MSRLCPTCVNTISDDAQQCPYCGACLPASDNQQYNKAEKSSYQTDTLLIRCPECGRVSDSIKQFQLPHIWAFLWIFLYHQNISYTCCPHCMRKHILVKGFTYNIITANLLWPFIILPWSAVQLIRSYSKGHSKDVLDIIR